MTIMPFGYHDYVLTLNRTAAELALGSALIVVGLMIALAVGWRRRQPVSLALSFASALGLGLGTVSLTRTAGPDYLYFAVWMAFVPLGILLAIGIATVGQRQDRLPVEAGSRAGPGPGLAAAARRPVESLDYDRPPLPAPPRQPVESPDHGRSPLPAAGRRRVRVLRRIGAPRYGPPLGPAWPARLGLAVLLTLTVTGAALTVQSDLRMGTIGTTTGSGPWPPGLGGSPEGRAQTVRNTAALIVAAEGVLRPSDRRVNITIGTGPLWPYAAGIVDGLDQRGIQSTVAPGSWSLYFGDERASGRPVEAEFDLYASTDGAARHAARGVVVADVDGAVLTYLRISS